MVGWPAHERRAPVRIRLRPRFVTSAALGRDDEHADGLSSSLVATHWRLRDRARPTHAPGAGGERGHGRPHRDPVGQGRSRCARPAQGRRARAGHAQRHPPRAGVHHRATHRKSQGDRSRRHRLPVPDPGHSRRGPSHLRHDLGRRYGGRVPDRITRPDEHAAAPAP
jgi:hypothetical protein